MSDLGLIGKKCGMTRVFTEEGVSIPVTVIEVLPNRITQIKTFENDGYAAIQVAIGERKRSRVNKPQAGHYAKAGVIPGEKLCEFRLDVPHLKNAKSVDLDQFKLGAELELDYFSEGQLVDVSGISKGKGFAGTIKRHNFRSQDATHGNSVSHRVPGSIGQRQSPGKVFKGKKMSGHLGNEACTVQSQRIIRIDAERKLILVRGAIPGWENAYVIIRPAVKDKAKGEGNGTSN